MEMILRIVFLFSILPNSTQTVENLVLEEIKLLFTLSNQSLSCLSLFSLISRFSDFLTFKIYKKYIWILFLLVISIIITISINIIT